MTAELQAKISECVRVEQERRDQAEAALNVFFDSVATALQEWLPNYVKAEVTTRSPEVTTTTPGTAEQLGALKKELADLGGKLPKLVRVWFGAAYLWPHRANYVPLSRETHSLNPQYNIDSTRAPYGLDAPLRDGLKSVLVPFMKRYGCVFRPT